MTWTATTMVLEFVRGVLFGVVAALAYGAWRRTGRIVRVLGETGTLVRALNEDLGDHDESLNDLSVKVVDHGDRLEVVERQSLQTGHALARHEGRLSDHYSRLADHSDALARLGSILRDEAAARGKGKGECCRDPARTLLPSPPLRPAVTGGPPEGADLGRPEDTGGV